MSKELGSGWLFESGPYDHAASRMTGRHPVFHELASTMNVLSKACGLWRGTKENHAHGVNGPSYRGIIVCSIDMAPAQELAGLSLQYILVDLEGRLIQQKRMVLANCVMNEYWDRQTGSFVEQFNILADL
jgi:hypothetical protein